MIQSAKDAKEDDGTLGACIFPKILTTLLQPFPVFPRFLKEEIDGPDRSC
jgi:hypothetical protein